MPVLSRCAGGGGLAAVFNVAQVAPGSSVAVIGCGGVGQSVIQGARIAGAAVIIAVDPMRARREGASLAGATHTVDPAATDPIDAVRELTAGRGADYSFEVVGRPELMVAAFEMARTAGTVTLVGMPAVTDMLTLPAIKAVFSGKRLAGAALGGAQILRDFPKFIRLAETGQLDQASYAASKLGLSGLTAELAVQWARHSIRVNTIAPGFFRSELTDAMYTGERSMAWLRRNTLLPMDGGVDDFLGAVLWLASDAGRYVTGQTIVIDGGWTAR